MMWPKFNTSPDLAETKLIGRRGISMEASALRASSSMLTLDRIEGLMLQDLDGLKAPVPNCAQS